MDAAFERFNQLEERINAIVNAPEPTKEQIKEIRELTASWMEMAKDKYADYKGDIHKLLDEIKLQKAKARIPLIRAEMDAAFERFNQLEERINAIVNAPEPTKEQIKEIRELTASWMEIAKDKYADYKAGGIKKLLLDEIKLQKAKAQKRSQREHL